MKNIFIIIVTIYSACVYILNVALSSVVIHRQVKNSLSEDIEYNQNHSLFFSLSDKHVLNTFPFNFGPYLIYVLHEATCTDSDGYSYDCSYYVKTPVDIFIWKGISLYATESDVSYLSLLYNNSVSKEEQCEDGYKQCGILDTVGNILCLPNDSECPINDIIITNSLSIPNEFINYTNINTIQINENNVLHYTNEGINKPIVVDFRLSQKMPCLKDNIDNCESNKGDGRFKLLDQMNFYTFYDENDLFWRDDKVDRYDKNINNKSIYLYYREYIGYDKNCIRNNKDFFMKSNYFKQSKAVRKLVIVVLSFSLVAMFFVPVLIWFYGNEDDIIILIVIMISVIFFIIFLLISFLLSFYFPKIISCSDEYSATLLDKVKHQKKMNQLYILILLIFNLLLLILVSLRKFSHAICDPIQNKYKISKRKSKLEKNFNISIDHIKLIEDAPFQICSIILLQDERIAVQGRTKIKIYNPYDDYKCVDIITDVAMIGMCQLDNGHIVTAHEDNCLKIKSIDGLLNDTIPNAHINKINHLEALSNNRIAISSSNAIIKIWVEKYETPFISYSLSLDSKVNSFCYIRNKNIIIAVSSTKKVSIWRGCSYQKICIIDGIQYEYKNMFQLDDKRIIMGNAIALIIINFDKCIIEKEITTGKFQIKNSFLKINDEDILFGTDYHLRIINVRTKTSIKTYPFNIDIQYLLRINDNNFVSCSKYKLSIWKYETYKS